MNYSSDVALVNCKTARLKYAQGEKLKYYESSLFVCSSRIGYYMFLFNEWMSSQSKTRLDVKLSLDITKKHKWRVNRCSLLCWNNDL